MRGLNKAKIYLFNRNIMWFSYLLFIISYLSFFQSKVYSQSSEPSEVYKNIKFEHLSIEHGLSQITVHAILQDSKGFLWFGTEDGLNRFDGYEFTTFKNDPGDPTSINDNFIWSIIEDRNGNIWIGTNEGGLNKYNYESNSFRYYVSKPMDINSLSENNIRTIYEDDEGLIWIGTNSGGLNKYDIINNKFTRYLADTENETSLSSNNIRAISQDDDGVLWIATEGGGLNSFDKLTNRFKNYFSFVFNKRLANIPNVWSVLADGHYIWAGSYERGLIKYNRLTKKANRYLFDSSENSIIGNNIPFLFLDKQNHLWICTESGLSIFDRTTNQFYNYMHESSDINSLSDNIIRSAYIDNSDLVWLGTVGGGANKVNLNRKFKLYTHNPSNENSISHNMIRAIYEDHSNNVWIGTLGKGLNKLNRNTGKVEQFSTGKYANSLSNEVITSILQDNQGFIWVGTWGSGLNRIKLGKDAKSNKTIIDNIKYYQNDPINDKSIKSNIVQAIFEDSKGNMWVGTEEGLDKFIKETNTFIHYVNDRNNFNSLSDNRIQSNCILEDKFGNIWVGTWKGLNRIRFFEEKSNVKESVVFDRFFNEPQSSNSLSDNRVVSLYEDKLNSSDSNTVLWIGTIGGGLNKLTISNSSNKLATGDYHFKSYTEKDGLPNNVVYGILGDDYGNIWLSTNNGIAKFDQSSGSFRNYDITDGLQSNQFFWGAYHKTDDGELFFGGINGLNSFYPKDLTDNTYIPPVYITNCTISNSPKNTVNKTYSLNEIQQNEKFELPYDSYTISFEFVALDFTTPGKNQFEYKLEGYDKDWRNIVSNNSVTYSNIGDGEYIFKVLGSNNDNVWNQNGASLQLVVLTPFWKTWWFISLIVIIILSLVVYFVATQIKNILAVERLRTKLAADLHDNIGSSLTEISILSEVINAKLYDAEKDVKKNLNKISNKSRDLIDKMSDIVWLVNPKRDSLYDLLLRLQDTYSELLADTNISLRSENLKALEKVSLKMEHRQHLFLIFKEGINNSITHSSCNEISLNAKVTGKKLEIVLSDNGKGLDNSQESKGNGLTNMKSRAQIIGGKLVINSLLGKGTTVKYIGNIN